MQATTFVNLERLGIKKDVRFLSMAQTDFRSVLNTLSRSEPEEIYPFQDRVLSVFPLISRQKALRV